MLHELSLNAENMTMSARENKNLISILMESPFYLTLSIDERKSLLNSLTSRYPCLSDCDDDEAPLGYESSWPGAIGR